MPLGAWSGQATFDWTLFVAALALAGGAALVVVLIPAVSLLRGDLREALGRARTRGIQGRGYSVNDVPETDVARRLSTGDLRENRYILLRKGKKTYAMLVVAG